MSLHVAPSLTMEIPPLHLAVMLVYVKDQPIYRVRCSDDSFVQRQCSFLRTSNGFAESYLPVMSTSHISVVFTIHMPPTPVISPLLLGKCFCDFKYLPT